MFEIKVPHLGESETEATLISWLKNVGDAVEVDDIVAEIESDKITMEITATEKGVLREQKFAVDATVEPGQVIGLIDTDAVADVKTSAPVAEEAEAKEAPAPVAEKTAAKKATTAKPEVKKSSSKTGQMFEIKVPHLGESETEATLISWLKQVGDAVEVDDIVAEIESDKITMEITATESGVLKEQRFAVDDTVEPGQVVGIIDTSASVTPKETQQDAKVINLKKEPVEPSPENDTSIPDREQIPVPMTRLRKRIATRLKEAQNTAAILTTFNEVNLQAVMDLRSKYQDEFVAQYGCKLGFMSFFIKACAQACGQFPSLNAQIAGDDVLYHNYIDMGVAVSTNTGLIVPVLRDVGLKSFGEIEQGVLELAGRAREGKLKPEDMQGGTFSITNGGVFGSMLSTPILNTPQSGILGMHTIQKRVVVEQDTMVIRPMMYLALSYDHRLIDGKDAVQFLVQVKSFLENPNINPLID